jgi:Ca2+-binding EF-hand superfamily protein
MKINNQTILKSIDYNSYRATIDKLFKEGKSTGPIQSEDLLHYTELNIHRMNRVEKTVQLTDDFKEYFK